MSSPPCGSGVNVAGLGVVGDMGFQHDDLRHAPLLRLDLCRKRVIPLRRGGSSGLQLLIIQQAVLPR